MMGVLPPAMPAIYISAAPSCPAATSQGPQHRQRLRGGRPVHSPADERRTSARSSAARSPATCSCGGVATAFSMARLRGARPGSLPTRRPWLFCRGARSSPWSVRGQVLVEAVRPISNRRDIVAKGDRNAIIVIASTGGSTNGATSRHCAYAGVVDHRRLRAHSPAHAGAQCDLKPSGGTSRSICGIAPAASPR